ncbi:MAG: hypothetical protein KGZ96_04210 [Clostridia bacterium]|nr:hypothetical protein [Clostridia bacterium]
MNNKQLTKVLPLIFGLILLLAQGYLFQMYQEARIAVSQKAIIYEISIFLIFFVVGILIEWGTIQNAIKNGFKINFKLFAFASILLLIAFIPLDIYILIFGIDNKIINLITPLTRTAISILSGIFIVRSLIMKNPL